MQPELTEKDWFEIARARLFKLIDKVLSIEPHCKSYEGSLEVAYLYPDYFEDPEGKNFSPKVLITCHCYVLGNGRHHYFDGKNLYEANKKFEHWLDQQAAWVNTLYEED